MADSKSIKVIYFDLTGRAEILRLILSAAGREFEDVRLARDKWPEFKPRTPFGQVPVVEIDGVAYAQTAALASYLAKEFNFYGKNNLEGLKIDIVGNLTEDLIQSFARSFREQDPVKKEEILKEIKKEVGPRFLGYFEKILKDNGTGFVVGDRVTLADLIIYDISTGFLKPTVEDSIKDFPLVQKVVETVGEIDGIKKYVASRQ
ncbi:unnamed protein product [Lymnaea stagnalis]|uniref:Uncharacterized protein n=1 Tax=Lymnaea stagnalis TaxID=6523 RepID=A0AAV2IPC7_LYMST